MILFHCERGGSPFSPFSLLLSLFLEGTEWGAEDSGDGSQGHAERVVVAIVDTQPDVYVARRNIGVEWSSPKRALSPDCVILRGVPRFDESAGHCLRFLGGISKGWLSTRMIYNIHKKKTTLRHYG
ncbi:hypothetical protein V8G54_009600 [Vigna mungo]|uniref:Uncharacterized protein n=1 Tax=Vigna mungo TaxID=3915 RepID=A0AAQ3NW36_VIGMU